jgi:hypothetical protein
MHKTFKERVMDEFRDLYDVINFMVDAQGHHTRQALAGLLKPTCETDYPHTWLSKVTNRGNNVGITMAEFDRLIELTGGAHILMRYLSQKYDISIPPKEFEMTPAGDGSFRARLIFRKVEGED